MARPLAYTTEEWIKKAHQKHDNKYDYSKVVYKGVNTRIIFNCPVHGDISQLAGNHLVRNGCRKCSKEEERKSTEAFIREAQSWHGDYYDYSLVEFTNTHDKVTIICPIHDEFLQTPVKHQRGHGCKRCKGREVWNQEDFLKKASKVHGNAFNYSKVEYKKTHLPVEIICNKCGYQFPQIPASHLSGNGCIKCAEQFPLTDDIFKDLLQEVHDSEIIALEEYKGNKKSIRFRHFCGHEWMNSPGNVIGKRQQGCKECYAKERRMSEKTFKQRLSKKHNGRIIALDKYITSNTKIKVKHLDCGRIWEIAPRVVMRFGCHDCAGRKTDAEFRAELEEVHRGEIVALEPYKTARNNIYVKHLICDHVWRPNPVDLTGKFHGCPKCSSSKGNRKIDDILSERNVNFIREKRFESCRYKNPLPFDFYLPEHEVLIEFDGEQHFIPIDFWGGEKGLEERNLKDSIKNQWAKENSKKLYRIRFDEDIHVKLEEIFR